MKDASRIHYQTFHHIFLYITEKCQLRCKHCYLGKRLDQQLSMDLEKIEFNLTYFFNIGARNLTILGGEPTLHKDFEYIVFLAKKLGYEKINIDTNGINISKILKLEKDLINYVRVSLDGPTSELHDLIRGSGCFNRTMPNIIELIDSGYNVAITCTITKHNIEFALNYLDLAEEIGIKLLNFHVLSEEGYGKNLSKWSLSQSDWENLCSRLVEVKNNYNVSIWYPPSWARRGKLNEYIKEGYQGCLGISLDRLSVFPDGKCYVCSVLFDTDYYYATIDKNGLHLNRNKNEFELFSNSFVNISNNYYSGCPAETILANNRNSEFSEEYISLCRCWKSQI